MLCRCEIGLCFCFAVIDVDVILRGRIKKMYLYFIIVEAYHCQNEHTSRAFVESTTSLRRLRRKCRWARRSCGRYRFRAYYLPTSELRNSQSHLRHNVDHHKPLNFLTTIFRQHQHYCRDWIAGRSVPQCLAHGDIVAPDSFSTPCRTEPSCVSVLTPYHMLSTI